MPAIGKAVRRTFFASWAFVVVAGLLAAIQLSPDGTLASRSFDPNNLTTPFGYLGNLLVSPFARWDSMWYLGVVKWGYHPFTGGVPLNPSASVARMNFYPLYLGLIHVVGWVTRSDLIAGILISVVSFIIALVLLYKLVCLDFPEQVAAVAVMLLAFTPMAFYFSAVYTESLFFALSLGSVYCAREHKWIWAGVLAALASITRLQGILLIVPLILLLPKPPARPPLRAVAIFLTPLAVLGYCGYLGLKYHSFAAPLHDASIFWSVKETWPLGGAWQGLVAAWHALQQISHGPTAHVYVPAYAGSSLYNAAEDLYQLGFLSLAVTILVASARRLPLAYTAYTLVSLAVPLTAPVVWQPLSGISRFEVVIFPLFIYAADWIIRKRVSTLAIASSAMLLGFFVVEFVTWNFVT
jgi:preprotein translocase subunit SecE